MSDEIDELKVYVAALYYYLYRQAGCPFGDNLSGYDAWIETSVTQPFNLLCEAVDTPLAEAEGILLSTS